MKDDQALPRDAARLFAKRKGATVVEVASGHLAMVSHPRAMVRLSAPGGEPLLDSSPGLTR
jgi:hypothetical protein